MRSPTEIIVIGFSLTLDSEQLSDLIVGCGGMELPENVREDGLSPLWGPLHVEKIIASGSAPPR